jgi:Kef-type K+ transport system membrane component KefB
MLLNIHWKLPLQDPTVTFALVLVIMLMAPVLMRKLRIPGIVGLILAGVAIGPFGFGLIEKQSIDLFAKAGLLYIMFLAGLELDISEFRKSKNKSLVFGLLTFGMPFIAGYLVCYQWMGYSVQASVLVGIMLATHTLIAYPIASRLGIARNEVVTVTVGGTIITDTLVLLILAVITGMSQNEVGLSYWLSLSGSLVVFGLVLFYLFPLIGRWFFKNVSGESTSHYIFILAMVFLAGVLAEIAGVDAILGAFFAGLSLNKLVPHGSPLSNRIDFVGNAIFIPFFLISVGMLVDLSILMKGPQALIVAAILAVVALTSKWLAALFAKYLFGYSSLQRKVMYGLSSARAAATIAVVLVGFRLGIVDETVLNGTVVLILVTCLISSFIVEKSGRLLAIQENEAPNTQLGIQDRILVPLSNPNSVEMLMELAMLVQQTEENEALYVLSVVDDGDQAAKALFQGNKLLDLAGKMAVAADRKLEKLTRVDYNITSGIVHTARENGITEIIMGWKPKPDATDKFFGGVMDNLLKRTDQMVLISKVEQPYNTLRRLVLVVPQHAELEPGFGKWLGTLRAIAVTLNTKLQLYSEGQTAEVIKAINKSAKKKVELSYVDYHGIEQLPAIADTLKDDDLLVLVCARKGAVSHTEDQEKAPLLLSKHFENANFIMVYPQQPNYPTIDGTFQIDGSLPLPIRQNLERINQLGNFVRKVIRGDNG